MAGRPVRVMTVVGARPQFVKASALARAIGRDFSQAIENTVVTTGQHYDDAMAGTFFRDLAIGSPAFDLTVGSGPHGQQTGEMLKRIEPVLITESPDVVLVYGDTNSTIAAALAAAKLGLPVAHVEAGLRSYRRSMPEEINRVVTDHLATHLYCPSQDAVRNLELEGITSGVKVVGDVMRDVFEEQRQELPPNPARVLGLTAGGYALATVHRAENTDSPDALAGIVSGLRSIVGKGLPVIWPIHPRTRRLIDEDELQRGGIRVIEPQPYGAVVALLSEARVMLTDSGGMQKEALWSGVPCVTLRDETEWVETIESGWNVLVGADPTRILDAALRPVPSGPPPSLYGDGRASARILDSLVASYRS